MFYSQTPVFKGVLQSSSMSEIHDFSNTWDQCWLWKVLLFTGFSRKNCQRRNMQLILKLLTFMFLHCRATFSIFLLSRGNGLTKSSVAAITINLCSLFVWYSMNFNEKNFKSLCAVIEKIQRSTIEKQYIENRKTNIQLLITFLIPFIFSGSMVNAYTHEQSRIYAEFWLLGYDLHNSPKLQLFLMFLSGMIYYSFLLNSSILVVTYVSFCNTIKNGIVCNMKFSNTKGNLLAAIEYNRLVMLCCKMLENCYSTPISIVLFQLSIGIFMAITLLLGFSVNPASVILQEILLLFSVCFILFCIAIITASRIPSVMEKTRLKYKVMYYKELAKCISDNNSSKEMLRLFKALSETKIFYFTACSTLRMNKTLIVSSLGCFLTYGLLMVQLSSLQVTGI